MMERRDPRRSPQTNELPFNAKPLHDARRFLNEIGEIKKKGYVTIKNRDGFLGHGVHVRSR
jgi:hypothetical protein